MGKKNKPDSHSVGEIVKILQEYPKDMILIDSTGRSFIHIINIENHRLLISTTKPICYCNKCGNYGYKEESKLIKDYYAYCPTCDENLYKIETSKLNKK